MNFFAPIFALVLAIVVTATPTPDADTCARFGGECKTSPCCAALACTYASLLDFSTPPVSMRNSQAM